MGQPGSFCPTSGAVSGLIFGWPRVLTVCVAVKCRPTGGEVGQCPTSLALLSARKHGLPFPDQAPEYPAEELPEFGFSASARDAEFLQLPHVVVMEVGLRDGAFP